MSEAQAEFSDTYKFISSCTHCGKPMARMSISQFERVGFDMEEADVYKVWIDPQHECTYLKIEAKL